MGTKKCKQGHECANTLPPVYGESPPYTTARPRIAISLYLFSTLNTSVCIGVDRLFEYAFALSRRVWDYFRTRRFFVAFTMAAVGYMYPTVMLW